MKKCSNCRKSVSEFAAVCPNCGANIHSVFKSEQITENNITQKHTIPGDQLAIWVNFIILLLTGLVYAPMTCFVFYPYLLPVNTWTRLFLRICSKTGLWIYCGILIILSTFIILKQFALKTKKKIKAILIIGLCFFICSTILYLYLPTNPFIKLNISVCIQAVLFGVLWAYIGVESYFLIAGFKKNHDNIE